MNKKQKLSGYMTKMIQCKARSLVGQVGLTADDVEDIEQELSTHLLERLPKFDPDKASPNTFAARLVDKKICSILRYRTQEIRDSRNKPRSLNEYVPDGEGSTVQLGYTLERDERASLPRLTPEQETALRLDVESVLASLPPDVRHLAELLKHMSMSDAAKEMGMPRTTLYRLRCKLRKALEAAGLDEKI